MVLVLRYGFNRDGLSSFDVRGSKALMYMWHIEQAAGGLHIRVPDTKPTLAQRRACMKATCLAVYALSPSSELQVASSDCARSVVTSGL